MKKVLITGATGFIGRHCLPLLSGKGYEVHAVTSRALVVASPDVHWHQTDLLAAGQVSKLVSEVRPSHLLHLAWVTTPGEYWTSSQNLCWVRASLELLQSFAEHGGKRVVIAGTCAEYDWRYGYCSEHVTPLAPATLYGACKNSLRSMLDAYAVQAQLSAAWGRIFFLYGPYEHPDRLVSSAVCSLLKGNVARCSHGNLIRDFLYVEDVADAFVALLESDAPGAFNIASGRPVILGEVVRVIADKLGRMDLRQLGAKATSAREPPLLVAAVSRLTNEIGWSPKYDLDRGLERTIAWWKNHLTEGDHEPAN